MMITSCVCGLIVLTGGDDDAEPELSYFEKIVDEAFQKADRDNSGQVSFDEFVLWARSNRDIMTSLESMNKVNTDANIQDDDDSAAASDEEYLSDSGLSPSLLVSMIIDFSLFLLLFQCMSFAVYILYVYLLHSFSHSHIGAFSL